MLSRVLSQDHSEEAFWRVLGEPAKAVITALVKQPVFTRLTLADIPDNGRALIHYPQQRRTFICLALARYRLNRDR